MHRDVEIALVVTFRDHLLELPDDWGVRLSELCTRYQSSVTKDPVAAGRVALELDDFWRELYDSDHLTPYLARLLCCRSPRGCREEHWIGYQAWCLATRGCHRSAAVLLETFELDGDWATLALGKPIVPKPIKFYRGKLRKLIEVIRAGEVPDVVEICRSDPRAYLRDFKDESLALELAQAGQAELAGEVLGLQREGERGLGYLADIHGRLGHHKDEIRLKRLLYGRGFRPYLKELPPTAVWEELVKIRPEDLFRLLLKALSSLAKPRLPDPVPWDSWRVDEPADDALKAVCYSAWKAWRGEPWLHELQETDSPLALAAQAQLLDVTGHHSEAATLRDRLPADPMLSWAMRDLDGLERERFIAMAERDGKRNRTQRLQRQNLQRLLDQGELVTALDQAGAKHLLSVAQTLGPEEDWDLVEARLPPVRWELHQIQLALLLGGARRARGELAKADEAFSWIRRVHPPVLKAVGGDRLPPFQLPLDSISIAAAVIKAMDPLGPEEKLRDYLLELPTSEILLAQIVQELVSEKSLAQLQGPFRPVLESLLLRFADFPWISSAVIGNLGWLYPEKLGELEKLLRFE